jgi:hypothetical protein
VTHSPFYEDEEGIWLVTGDQAIMDENGEFKIIGRYKDLIIRGGENISPSSIESVMFTRLGITAEVIGIPDDIAGEIPIAVIKRTPDQKVDLAHVRETLVRELGVGFAPEEIIDIQSLDLEDYPRTASGKVRKIELKTIVLEKRTVQKIPSADDDILEMLLRVWTKLLGVNPGTITPETSIHDWADSLVLARFSGVLYRDAGQSISLFELTENATPKAQAKLLSSRDLSTAPKALVDIPPSRQGPPTNSDMVHTYDDEDRVERTKELCSEILSPLGLGWEDVEAILPMGGVSKMFLTKRRPQSSNHRHVFLCPGSTPSSIQNALERVLIQHAMLRTMAIYFDPSTPLHVVMRPSTKWFSNTIMVTDPVQTCAELSQLGYNDPALNFAAFPGPLFRCIIAEVKDKNCAGLAYMVQHSIFDAVSIGLVFEDLELLLSNPKATLKPHVSYKTWIDGYYSLSDSIPGRRSVAWQVKRLSKLGAKRAALFPVQRTPEWFKGDASNWIDLETNTPGPARKVLDKSPVGLVGIHSRGKLPDIQVLKRKHGVEAAMVLKAALAVVNTRYTKEPSAIFWQVQAGRTWPFLSDWQAARMPPAMDANGPLLQGCVNLIDIYQEESVADLLKRLQAEQLELNKHAYAPLDALVAALNAEKEPSGDLIEGVFRRQIFNWLPKSVLQKNENLQSVMFHSLDDCGLIWNIVMPDHETVQINPHWDDAQLRRSDIERMVKELLEVASAFATSKNWELTVAEVVSLVD